MGQYYPWKSQYCFISVMTFTIQSHMNEAGFKPADMSHPGQALNFSQMAGWGPSQEPHGPPDPSLGPWLALGGPQLPPTGEPGSWPGVGKFVRPSRPGRDILGRGCFFFWEALCRGPRGRRGIWAKYPTHRPFWPGLGWCGVAGPLTQHGLVQTLHEWVQF